MSAKKIDLETIKERAIIDIAKAKNLEELNKIFKQFFGKEGELNVILRSLKDLPKLQRITVGQGANDLKKFLEEIFEKKERELIKRNPKKNEKGEIDVTAPGKKITVGHLHPLTLTKRKIVEIFQMMGFSVVDGPEMENEWYNFDALNIPKNHPARDMWDTFWIKKPVCQKTRERFLLRTHTSPVQIRYMEKNQPPLRIIVPGRIFRHEATDASHETNFYQVEGLMIDKNITASNYRAIIEEFLSRFFDKTIKTRLRPSFFPFTEPSFEIDVTCLCGGKGCSVCSKTGWLELMGAGMVHPNVLKNAGLNPKFWQGFAFGVGMDRLAMMKYKINDIRFFYSGDLRFLQQF